MGLWQGGFWGQARCGGGCAVAPKGTTSNKLSRRDGTGRTLGTVCMVSCRLLLVLIRQQDEHSKCRGQEWQQLSRNSIGIVGPPISKRRSTVLGPRQLMGGMRAGEFGDGQAFETEDCVYLLSRVWGEQRGAAAVGSRPWQY